MDSSVSQQGLMEGSHGPRNKPEGSIKAAYVTSRVGTCGCV